MWWLFYTPQALALVASTPDWRTERVRFDGQLYSSRWQRAGTAASNDRPPLLCLPPIGVGITRNFYNPLHREWAALGAPSDLHSPELLGNGDASPKPRRFYSPSVWAEQLLDYQRRSIARPAILVVQGGLLPVALEMWRMAGAEAIAGVSLCSPPPLRFISPEAPEEKYVRGRFRGKPSAPGRLKQRAAWALSNSPAGALFFRYLGSGDGLPRIRSFSERNLFYSTEKVDDEWIQMCDYGSRDARSRFATFSYLAGTIPGGTWRDDRAALLSSLDVPCQVLRGGGIAGAEERLQALVASVPRPSCSELVPEGRAVLPYENARVTAELLARFLEANWGSSPSSS